MSRHALSLRTAVFHPFSFFARFAAVAFLLLSIPAQAALEAKNLVVRPFAEGPTINGRLPATNTDGGPLYFEIVTPPAHGDVWIQDLATGEFFYTPRPFYADPNPDPRGRDSFTWRVSDGMNPPVERKAYLTVLSPGNRRVAVAAPVAQRQPSLDWYDVVSIAEGENFTVGLRVDGTVMAADMAPPVDGMKEVVALAAGSGFVAALRNDGTVVVSGSDELRNAVSGWQEIVAIAAASWHVVGLKADGTVVAAGVFDAGQLNVGAWTDVVAVSAGEYVTAGLRGDGTVVTAGDVLPAAETASWTNMTTVAAGNRHVVGLRSDGMAMLAGASAWLPEEANRVSGWHNLMDVAAGFDNAIGVGADGTLVVAGNNQAHQLDVTAFGSVVAVSMNRWSTSVMMNEVPPVAPDITIFANPGGEVSTQDLRTLVRDPNGDRVMVGSFGQGGFGSVTDRGDGTLTYLAAPDASGVDSFTYTLTDGMMQTTGTIRVVINWDWDNDGVANPNDAFPLDPAEYLDTDHDGIGNNADTDDDGDGIADDVDPFPLNARPVAQMLNVHVLTAGDTVNGVLPAYDPEGDPKAFELVTPPYRGTVTIDPYSGAFIYTADHPGNGGLDSFTFRVRDETNMPTQQTVHLTIRPRGDQVVAVGRNVEGQLNVDSWTNVVQVAAGVYSTVGVRADGTVLATGRNYWGDIDVGSWTNIVAVSMAETHTVGLKADGTVVVAGTLTPPDLSGWSNIVAVSAGTNHFVGLRADGTVVATGDNSSGQCDVSGWRDIVAVAADGWRTVGLKSDGSVVAAGGDLYGVPLDTSAMYDVIALDTSDFHTVGLNAFGRLEAFGDNTYGALTGVTAWTDVVAVDVSSRTTVAIRNDGSLLTAGNNAYGQLNVGGWSNIVSVSAGDLHTVGLKQAVVAPVQFTLSPGSYTVSNPVFMFSPTEGAQVHYTVDGSEPTEQSPIVTELLVFSPGTVTIKAKGFKPGCIPSAVASGTYIFYPMVDATIDGTGFRLSGGSGQYTFTVRPNANGAVGTLIDNGDGTYTFVPPTTGAFAGDYVIDVYDPVSGGGLHMHISVPLRVTTERRRLLSHDALRNDMEVVVRGAAAGTRMFMWLDQASEEAGITTTANDGIAADNVADANPARFLVTAPDALAQNLTVTLKAVCSGAQGFASVDAIPAVPYRGQVFNTVAEPIAGATVTLLSATGANPALPWEDDLGRITAVSGSDGGFTLYAPPTADQEVHSLRVTALTYSTVSEPAANCAQAPCVVSLAWESNAAAPVYTPAAGTYEQGVLVTIDSPTVDARLRYTTDGTAPTRTSGIEVANGTGVQLSRNTTLKAVAYKDGLGVSTAVEGAYVIVPANAATALAATVVGPGVIDLAWTDNSAKESGYRVYRAVGNGGFEAIALVGANVTSYKDTAVAANTSYRYYVVAYVSGAESAASNIVTASTALDTVAPTISSVLPASGATGVPLNRTITVTFSEPVKCSTVTGTTFNLKNASGVVVASTVSCSGATATLTPSALLSASKTYTVNVTKGVTDLAGNALAAAKSWKFTTGSTKDSVKPTVTATTPAANASNVPVTQVISATFSENLDCSSVTAGTVLLASGGSSVAGTLSCSGKTVTFDPTALLTANAGWTLTFTTGIRDQARNALAANYVVTFTTAP